MLSFFKKDFLNQLWLNFEKLLEITNQNNEFKLLPSTGLLLSKVSDNDFLVDIKSNLKIILNQGEGATKTRIKIVEDSDDMEWVLLSDKNLFDLLSSVYTAVNAVNINSNINNLIAIALKFSINIDNKEKIIFLICRMDLRSFYPFAPTSNKLGDRNDEIENLFFDFLRSNRIKLENNKRNWLGLWGIPV